MASGQVFGKEFIEGSLLIWGQWVDLAVGRLRVWYKLYSVVPRFVSREYIKGFLREIIQVVIEVFGKAITRVFGDLGMSFGKSL